MSTVATVHDEAHLDHGVKPYSSRCVNFFPLTTILSNNHVSQRNRGVCRNTIPLSHHFPLLLTTALLTSARALNTPDHVQCLCIHRLMWRWLPLHEVVTLRDIATNALANDPLTLQHARTVRDGSSAVTTTYHVFGSTFNLMLTPATPSRPCTPTSRVYARRSASTRSSGVLSPSKVIEDGVFTATMLTRGEMYALEPAVTNYPTRPTSSIS